MKFLIAFAVVAVAFAAAAPVEEAEQGARDKRGLLIGGAPLLTAPAAISTVQVHGAPALQLRAAPALVSTHGLIAPNVIAHNGLIASPLIGHGLVGSPLGLQGLVGAPLGIHGLGVPLGARSIIVG